jgi:GNAT superfamily N-acetyltransferase
VGRRPAGPARLHLDAGLAHADARGIFERFGFALTYDDGMMAAVSEIEIRRATRDDIGPIVRMLADDQLGATRESADDLGPYLKAFEDIDADASQLLMVADAGGDVVGTLQLTIIPGLARKGALRGQVEAVRVRDDQRGNGLGGRLMAWAIEESRRRGCALVQLTSDVTRVDAHRFYERLGFVASHQGFKLKLTSR